MPNINSDPLRRKPFLPALVSLFFLFSCGNRANPAPKPQPPPPFEFLGAWGDKGDGPGKLDAPVSFAADSLGDVFFPDVSYFQSWRSAAQRHFSGAMGIGIDEEGTIYAPDSANLRVQKFNNHGH